MKHELDITKEHCPMTFVKTRLKLDSLQSGDILTVRLNEGEPLENVPRTVEELGHKVLNISNIEGSVFAIEIQKA